MDNLVSIILPIYNSEKYLKECLDSIEKQTYKNFEVIVIDDGSKDNSKLICKEMTKKYNQFKYFYKANGGVSSARNLGIKKATGKYICFIDSDDILCDNFIETLVVQMNKNENCLVSCSYKTFNEKTRFNIKKTNSNQICFFKENGKYDILFNVKCLGYLWNKIYDADIIKKNLLCFDERLYICEDLEFNVRYLKYCNSSLLINNILYFYREHNSSSKNYLNIKWFSIFDSLINVFNSINYFSPMTKKKFILFCKDTINESFLRRKILGTNINFKSEEELKKLVKGYNYISAKVIIKKFLYKHFGNYVINIKMKKGRKNGIFNNYNNSSI